MSKKSKTFPIVIETWTESERGWGCRPDGMTAHLSMADHKKFVDDFNKKFNNRAEVPDEYTRADMNPKIVDAEESLYERLVEAKGKGEFGLWAPSREGEKLMAEGKDPFEAEDKLYDIRLMNVAGHPLDPLGIGLDHDTMKERVDMLGRAGFEVKVIEKKPQKKAG